MVTTEEENKLRVQTVEELEYSAFLQKCIGYPLEHYALLLLAAKIIKFDNQELFNESGD